MSDRSTHFRFGLAALVVGGLTLSDCFRIDWDWEGRLAAAEQNLKAGAGEESRFYALADAAKAAVELGQHEKAKSYASELLELAPSFPENWNYGNAVHDGHMVLGRVALAHGDVKSASDELRAAGASPGSPQLNSFGPNMSLAKELLEAGEKQVVLDYFEQVGAFWSMGVADLERWTARVHADRTPDFGVALVR